MRALLATLLFTASCLEAHMIWLAPGEGGFKLFYGDLTEDIVEKGEEKLKKFMALAGHPAMREDHLFFAAKGADFKLDNLDSEVRDPKPGAMANDGYPSVASKSFQYLRYVANPMKAGKAAKGQPVDLVPTGKELGFQVLKQGKPAEGVEVQLIAPNGWVRPLYPDKDGLVKALTPWPGLYIMKATWKDRSGGEFQGKEYQLANHVMVLSFQSR